MHPAPPYASDALTRVGVSLVVPAVAVAAHGIAAGGAPHAEGVLISAGIGGLFALMYGLFRFVVEFVRLPDAQLGYLAFGWLTMGPLLSLPLVAIGLYWLWKSRSQPTLHPKPMEVT